jgi:hypothetical protein
MDTVLLEQGFTFDVMYDQEIGECFFDRFE